MTNASLASSLAVSRILVAAIIDDPAQAVPLARALAAGGLSILEVTFRNVYAAECIRRIRAEVPEVTVGAGTLLTPAQVDAAQAAGAAFGVSPGFNPLVVRHAAAQAFPFAPGVLSPGEMEQSLELGCHAVKFFPARAAGGQDFLRAVAAPYAHTPLRFIPLGGVGEADIPAYLSIPLVIAVGGSWLADRKLAAAGHWAGITELARRAVAAAASVPRADWNQAARGDLPLPRSPS